MDKNHARKMRYARDPEYRLRSVNRKRDKRGKPLLANADEIGREFLAHCWSRTRDGKGRYL